MDLYACQWDGLATMIVIAASEREAATRAQELSSVDGEPAEPPTRTVAIPSDIVALEVDTQREGDGSVYALRPGSELTEWLDEHEPQGDDGEDDSSGELPDDDDDEDEEATPWRG